MNYIDLILHGSEERYLEYKGSMSWDDISTKTKVVIACLAMANIPDGGSIQPRTTVWRYGIDNRSHTHIGYNLFFEASTNEKEGPFSVAISEKQMQSGRFRIGDIVEGTAWTKKYPERDCADYYRVGALKRVSEATAETASSPPPWKIAPPDVQTYEWRGARMLSRSCWQGKCFQCVWANMANVTIEYDWGQSQKWQFESFCYGPKSCKFYKMGKARPVPYKGRGSSLDDGGLDEICTENRGLDD